MAILLAAAVAASAWLAAAGPGAVRAQEPPLPDAEQLEDINLTIVQAPQAPVEPGTFAQVRFGVTYNCAKVHPEQGATIQFAVVDKPDWVESFGVPAVPVSGMDTQGCVENGTKRSIPPPPVVWAVTVSGETAAGTRGTITYNASIDHVDGRHEDEEPIDVEVAFVGTLDAGISQQGTPIRNNTAIRHDVDVTNLGNAPLRVTFDPVAVDDGLELELPGAVEVDWRGGPGSHTWSGSVVAVPDRPAPGQTVTYTARIEASSVRADDPGTEGDTRTMSLSVRVSRPPAEDGDSTPGPGPVAVAAAGALAALWVRRRKDGGDRRRGGAGGDRAGRGGGGPADRDRRRGRSGRRGP